eukprot:7178601-Alexandrium_andersonii.AAC.1
MPNLLAKWAGGRALLGGVRGGGAPPGKAENDQSTQLTLLEGRLSPRFCACTSRSEPALWPPGP